MKGVPVRPRRVFGVAFSGARDAGKAIRVCRGHPGEAGVRVGSVDPLAELPGGTVERADAFRLLVRKVTEAPRSAWGFDFAFALPRAALALVAEGERAQADGDDPAPGLAGDGGRSISGEVPPDGWTAQLEVLASLGDPSQAAKALRAAVRGRELERPTEEETHTSAWTADPDEIERSCRGMLGVLRPLRGREGVAILPLDPLPLSAADQGGADGSRLRG